MQNVINNLHNVTLQILWPQQTEVVEILAESSDLDRLLPKDECIRATPQLRSRKSLPIQFGTSGTLANSSRRG